MAAEVSRLRFLAVDDAGSDVPGGGGGSMTGGAGDGFDRGSGRDGIGSSGEEVSIVMCFVTGGDCRKA